jgi:methionine biosynthesis protein MetW
MRVDFEIVKGWVPEGSHVLDLACGDGTLLRSLVDDCGVSGYGLENDPDSISQCIQKGVNVIEKELVRDLDDFTDNSFDLVIMTQAIQAMKYPDIILEEMLRVGRECIVTFPNFGNMGARIHLATKGKMPVTKSLPYQWYDTPNIHFCTVADFRELCRSKNYEILNQATQADRSLNKSLKGLWPNLFAETAIYHLTKEVS